MINQEIEVLSSFQPKLIETINENIDMIGKLYDNINASNSQDKTKESLQKFLDVSNNYILNLLLTLEGLETGTYCLESRETCVCTL